MSKQNPVENSFSALDRQKRIYTQGMSGEKPIIPIALNALEAKAKAKMDREGFAYVAGGAGIEDTVQNNRSGFSKWRIIPRMLRDVSQCDTKIELLGEQLAGPLLLSPENKVSKRLLRIYYPILN